MVRKIKNPLRKRILRDLKGNAGRYTAIFLLLLLTISFGSGFLIAGNSLLTAYNNSFEKYNVEWGHFTTENRMNDVQWKVIQSQTDVTFYDMTYSNRSLDNGSTLRLYAVRDEVNQQDVLSGRLPETAQETAIDRMYAANNKIEIGDTISDGTYTWTVTGLVALSDYSSMFEKNTDSMFNATAFGVGLLSEEGMEEISSQEKTWCWSWMYPEAPADDAEEADLAEDLLEVLNSEVELDQYVPRYKNQAINFTGEDFGGDKVMMEVIIYLMIVILAFVFTVTINSTIQSESAVIGTLLASGYTRAELVRHYMCGPLLVTLAAAVTGNILGYTVLKDVVAYIYYQSYSLPSYVTIWNAEAFLKTTVIPLIIMAAVSFVSLNGKLKLSPLKFLRRDLKKNKQKSAIALADQIPFFRRFRIRVVLQNAGTYLTLFAGILFADLMLFFGLAMPLTMHHYEDTIGDTMFAKYQYMLNAPVSMMSSDHKVDALVNMLKFEDAVETENPDAEKFSAASLNTTVGREEEITVYGVDSGSRYVDLDSIDGTTAVSSAYAEKAQLSIGDTILLKDPYEEKYYSFQVDGIIPYEGGLCVFTDREVLNEAMDYGEDYFCGYFSDTPITDLDEQYLGTVIDRDSLIKTTQQLLNSLGDMMYLFDVFAVVVFVVLMYLLGKLVIEKNVQSISMVKILGYSKSEIVRLYVMPTAIVTVLELLLSMPIIAVLLNVIWNYYVALEMNGWMACYMNAAMFAEAFLLGVLSYALVSLLELRRIGRIPMDEALKNVE